MLSIIYHEPDSISPNGYFTAERNGFQVSYPCDTGPEALKAAYYHHAWPGGYPAGWLSPFGEVLCADCALSDMIHDGTECTPFLFEENEHNEYCEDCGHLIAEGYAEVEDPTDMTIAEYLNSDEDFEVVAFRLPGGA